ncbi:SurA N-terminal domain-containing protein [Desulfoplanes sp.]
MLDIIRQHSQSWGVKLLFGLIVLVFVFWGVGSFRNNGANIVARVNERNITVQDFQQEYEKRLQALRQQRPNLTSEDIKAMEFKKQVLDAMINQELLSDLATKENILVSDVELRNAIMHMPVFLNEAKQFDKNRYQALLRANRLDPVRFEAGFAQDLKIQKVREYFSMPAVVSEDEAKDFFLFAREQARIDYILYDQNDYLDQVDPGEEQIRTYYENHKDAFTVPAKIKVAYLLLSPETLADPATVSQQAINDYYAAHAKDFKQPEQIKARHILVRVPEDGTPEEVAGAKNELEKILAKYQQGTPFEELATTYSQGPSKTQGGDLGWFPQGRMVPEFEEAAFALDKGEISPPVRTPFGFHLIMVEDRRPEGIQSLEAVQDQIGTILAREQAADTIQDALDQALELVITGEDLAKAGETLGVAIGSTGFFSQAEGPRKIELPAETIADLFTLMDGEITQAPILLEDGYLLAQKISEQPAHTLDIEEVEPRIIATLKQEGAKSLALETAKTDLARLLKDPVAGLKEIGSRVKTSEPFGRQGFVPGLGMQPELVEKSFSGPEKAWYDTTFPVNTGAVLAKLNERIEPDAEAWDKEASYWKMTLEKARQQELFSALITSLRQKGSIEIMDSRVLGN